jgi:RNA polymerase sigma-70 factor (ECF subfamily)
MRERLATTAASFDAERPQLSGEALRQIELEIPRLRRYARYTGHAPDRADELVRQSLVRAVMAARTPIGSIHTGPPPGSSLRGWLFTSMRSCHIDEIGHGQRLDPCGQGKGASPPSRGNQEAVAALSELRDAYLSLSEEHREVLLLTTIEDLQHEEVAAILGVPLATVRARLSLARRALCQALEADRNRHGG